MQNYILPMFAGPTSEKKIFMKPLLFRGRERRFGKISEQVKHRGSNTSTESLVVLTNSFENSSDYSF